MNNVNKSKSNNTWFDAFFQALTSSPEFKSVMTTDYKKEVCDWISKMTKSIKKDLDKKTDELKVQEIKTTKAWSLFEQLNWQFTSPEVIEAGQKYTNQNETEKKVWEIDLNIVYPENKNPKTYWFLGVAGMDELKKELNESFISPLKFKFFIEKLKNEENSEVDEKKKKLYLELYDKYEKFWISIPTWVMFYGPPGTWKTFITKKLAEELSCWLVIKSVWEFGSSYMHQTSKNIREFFAKAKKAAEKEAIILFLDEIDSLVSKRTDRIDSNKAEEINQFLQEINDIKNAKNLILIWATNRPDHLDSAIMRSGRFDKKIYIWAPDFEARKELFKIFIEKQDKPHDILDYDELARLTEGYVSADIEAICDEASRDASKSILDLMILIEKDLEEKDYENLKKDIHNNVINMELLKQAIIDTTSSLKIVDMSIYDEWNKINN